ncbi:MAG: pyroglutamyl-peptidase I [Pseudolabrys sp.]|jgi:pyroglutamyl-peptidase
MPTILITGFGPFPGAPYNPTVKLVRALARIRRPALADTTIVAHVFKTSYAAVDRDLPALIAQHRPDALLMFGLHGRARAIRIETRARNALALLPDASGKVLRRSVIAPEGACARKMPMPARRLLAAVRETRLPAVLSRDAGRYLCNYLCWRATESGVRLATFVHVPKVARNARPKRALKHPSFRARALHARRGMTNRHFTAAGLARVGEHVLVALNAAVNRT